MIEILQKDNPLLRQQSQPVPLNEIKSAVIQTLIKQMTKVLDQAEDGLALAAPQIGTLKRIFIVSGKLFPDEQGKKTADLVFINPQIAKIAKKTDLVEEGCLSTRWLYGNIRRAEKITVEAYDRDGRKFSRNGSGLLAQVFQHEIDHLNGILFTDRAKNVREVKPEKKP